MAPPELSEEFADGPRTELDKAFYVALKSRLSPVLA